MLFIFSTRKACKYLMRIETEPELRISDHMTHLKETLTEFITFPDGRLHQICPIGNLLVIMWNFGNYTHCSDATDEDFVFTSISEAIFKLPKPYPKGTVSLPFFILEEEKSKVFEDVDHQILNEVSAQTGLNSLRKSLEAHRYNVDIVDSSKTPRHYCQFWGGGDLCAALDQGISGGDMPSSKLSPLTNGDSKLASLYSSITQIQMASLDSPTVSLPYGLLM